jgi:hypothetical protein
MTWDVWKVPLTLCNIVTICIRGWILKLIVSTLARMVYLEILETLQADMTFDPCRVILLYYYQISPLLHLSPAIIVHKILVVMVGIVNSAMSKICFGNLYYLFMLHSLCMSYITICFLLCCFLNTCHTEILFWIRHPFSVVIINMFVLLSEKPCYNNSAKCYRILSIFINSILTGLLKPSFII